MYSAENMTIIGSKSIYFENNEGVELELFIRVVIRGADPQLFLVMQFNKQGVLIDIPTGIEVNADTDLYKHCALIIPPAAQQFSFPMKIDFHICYMNRPLASGRRGIKTVEEIYDFTYPILFSH